MKVIIKEFFVSTLKKYEVIKLNSAVNKILKESNVKEGLCIVFTPHATAAIIINENYDPNIGDDFQRALSSLIPEGKWLHDNIDENGAAHIKASIIGPSETIPVKDGKLMLGQWQDIMLADFDGPRDRRIIIQIAGI